jgi:hypothetical protein
MSALALPDLSALEDARGTVLGGISALADALLGDPEALTASLTGGTAKLSASVALDADALTGPLQEGLAGLTDSLPSGGLDGVQALVEGVGKALAVVEPLREVLLSGTTLRDLRDVVLDQVGDPTERLGEVLTRLGGALPTEVIEPLSDLVEAITSFEGLASPDPTELGAFLARGLLGVPADLIDGPRAALDGFLAGIDALVDADAVAALEVELQGIAADLTAVTAAIEALDVEDIAGHAALAASLGSLRDRMLALRASLLALATGLSSGLAALDASALIDPLAAALGSVPEVRLPRADDFSDLVLEPIRAFRATIEATTPAQVAQAIAGLRAYVQESLAGLGAVEVLEQVLAPLASVGEAIEGMGLDALRDELSDALGGVGDAIGEVTGAIDGVRGRLVDALGTAADALSVVRDAGGELQTVLGDVAQAVESAAGGISLVDLRDQGLAVIGELETALGDVQSVVEGGAGQLEALLAQLDEIDLRAAAQVAFDVIDTITEALRSIDVTLLPDAAVQELKSVLSSALGEIDLAPLRATLDEALDGVPFGLLDELSAKLDELAAELESLSPGGLLEPLEAPFDEVVGALVRLDPAALLDPVIVELEGLQAQAAALSPATLLAPLDAPLASAREALETFDPATLLEPLNEPYAKLRELFDRLDVRPFLDELDGFFFEWLEQGLGGLQQLGDAFGGAGGVKEFADAAAGAVTGPDPIGFMPGDILRPVEDVYDRIVGLLDALPAETLVAGFEELRSGIVGTLDQIAPSRLAAVVESRIAELRAGFDVVGDFAVVEELYARYDTLRFSFDAIDEARVPGGAQASFQLSTSLVLELDPEAVLAPVRASLATLRADGVSAVASIDTSVLATPFGPVAARLDRIVPQVLREPLTVDAIRAHLAALDPGLIADEVNAEFEACLLATAKFSEVLIAELPLLAQALATGTTSALPAAFREAFDGVYGPLFEQLDALDPASLAVELEAEVYAPIRASLEGLSLSSIIDDAGLTAQLDAVASTVAGVAAELAELRASLGSAWVTVQENVLAVSPATVRAELDGAFTNAAQLIASIDLRAIADAVREAFTGLADEVDVVLANVVEALRELVDAIPAGIEGVSVSADVQVG